jgi:hypothetical protein
MKSMLTHSFVLDALETTGAGKPKIIIMVLLYGDVGDFPPFSPNIIFFLLPKDTFSHFEMLIEEHRRLDESNRPSRLNTLVPTIGKFHTHLPLRQAFEIYNEKHRLTSRKHIQISFNEIRHILNLARKFTVDSLLTISWLLAWLLVRFVFLTLSATHTHNRMHGHEISIANKCQHG